MDEIYLSVIAFLMVAGIIGVAAYCELRVIKAYRGINCRLADDLVKTNERLHAATIRNVKANEEIRALEDKLREKDNRIRALQVISTNAMAAMESMSK